MAQYAHLADPDPELAAGLAQMAQFVTLPEDIQLLRQRPAIPALSFPESQLKVQDLKIPVQGGEIVVRTYISQNEAGQSNPLLVWAHGGGFVSGGLHTHDSMLKKLSVDVKLSIVSVDYRLAPEHPFPTGLNDTYEALKWAYKNCNQLDADTTKGFLLGGCSAGGNFAAVLAHRARDDPELRGKVTGQILQIPMVLHKDAIPEKYKEEIISFEQNKNAPILDLRIMKFFIGHYGCTDLTDPDLAPIYSPSHKDLPPALFQICGLDPLRDEGLLYEKLLREDGVKTKLNIYPGLPHAFDLVFPTFKQSAKHYEDLTEGTKWLLRGGTE